MMKNNRREFIKRTGMAGLAVSTTPIQTTLGNIISPGESRNNISFVSPVDGDMLNSYDGTESDDGLLTSIKVLGPSDMKIKINGTGAIFGNGVHTGKVILKDYRNVIEAVDPDTGISKSIIVFWLKNYVNKYRLSLDDNVWFMKDIAKNQGTYKSIFANPYLGFLKQVHDTYGTKIHLNLYYQTDGFNLSQMTDKYKNEWKENSGWLRLSFHALQNDPDRPYINAGYNEVKKDCEMVKEQIRRFAGEELMGPVTTLHWGEGTVEGCRALRDEGYGALAGYFNLEGPDTVSYYLDDDMRRHVNNRFIWRDNREGIIFARLALVINTVQLEQIVPYLDQLRSDSHKPAYIDLMIHEQYFYQYYKDYQADYRQKVLTSVKWAADNGYEPAFLSECIFS